MGALRWTCTSSVVAAALIFVTGLPFAADASAAAVPANDRPEGAATITGAVGSVIGTTEDATPDNSCIDGSGSRGGLRPVWFRWRPPSTGLAVMTTEGSDVAATLSAHSHWGVCGTEPLGTGSGLPDWPLSVGASPDVELLLRVDSAQAGAVRVNWRLIPSPAPSNDDVARAEPIDGPAGSIPQSLAGATAQAGEPLHAGAAGGRSVWFSWLAPATAPAVFRTQLEAPGTMIGIYTGSEIADLRPIASDTGGGGAGSSLVRFDATRAVEYLIAVDGWEGASGLVTLTWHSGVSPPGDAVADAQPIDGDYGQLPFTTIGATLEATEPSHGGERGTGSVWFRWKAPVAGRRYFWAAIDEPVGSTSPTGGIRPGVTVRIYQGTSFDDLRPVDATPEGLFDATAGGEYLIAVEAQLDQAASGALVWEGRPGNDDLDHALPIRAEGTTATHPWPYATVEAKEPDHAGVGAEQTAWLAWVPATATPVVVHTRGSPDGGVIAVYRGDSYETLVEVGAARHSTADPARIALTPEPGAQYRIAISNFITRVSVTSAAVESEPPNTTVIVPVGATTGPLQIQVDAEDASGIAHVEVLVLGHVIGSRTAPPWSFQFDSATVPDGVRPEAIEARVSDAHGNVTVATATFVAENRIPDIARDATAGLRTDQRIPGLPEPTEPATATCVLDGESLPTCEPDEIPAIGLGHHVLQVSLEDTAGRRTRRPRGYSWVALSDLAVLLMPPQTAGPPSHEPLGIPFHLDPTRTARAQADGAIGIGVAMSRTSFPRGTASYAVIARSDEFADALAGSSLARSGPILFTGPNLLPPETADELDRVFGAMRQVYVLGGRNAISDAVVEQLEARRIEVRRLAGASRVETALAVADEVRRRFPGVSREAGGPIVTRAYGTAADPTAAWADAVAVGPWAAINIVPVLLTPTAALHPAVAEWLARDDSPTTFVLGGRQALSAAVEAALPSPQRISGPERAATAAAIAAVLWHAQPGEYRRFAIVDGRRADGWAYGLAAASTSGPLLLVDTGGVPKATAELVTSCGSPLVELLAIGSAAVIPDALLSKLDALDPAGPCMP